MPFDEEGDKEFKAGHQTRMKGGATYSLRSGRCVRVEALGCGGLNVWFLNGCIHSGERDTQKSFEPSPASKKKLLIFTYRKPRMITFYSGWAWFTSSQHSGLSLVSQ